ncbi:MAG: T9SS type A sorting domain-containing protein [Candidatus Chryseobacterium colombiense]|nr:T9SS type A sorting domain-containing protein [Chryseobacterium sp.]WEK68461.1 MAG: T9SS type A sorting domain-containing protein [Chryseobacterium sp.]
MKKTILFLFLTFIMSLNALRAQNGGSDYIIVLDNGSSMSTQRFTSMKLGATKLIQQLLSCNPLNRVAVVHYGTGIYNASNTSYSPKIYIESDFSNNTFTTLQIERRLDNGDHFHEALAIIGNALDGVSNTEIVSPQTTLNNDPSNPLKVVLFADAERNTGNLSFGSYLVNYDYPTPNMPEAFKYVTDFKINRNAKFAVIHISPDTPATEAAASISSQGGSYSGTVETNIDDPDYGSPTRLYFPRTSFDMSSSEVDYWARLATQICDTSGWGGVNFKYEPNGCGTDLVQTISGSYSLPAGATFSQFKLVARDIVTGQDYGVNFNPTMTSPTDFYYALQPSDFSFPGITDAKFVFILGFQYNYQGGTYDVASWNGYPYFDYDLLLTTLPNCGMRQATPSALAINENSIQITPNPTSGAIKVILDQKKIESGKVQIIDLSGKTVYSKEFRAQNTVDIDIHSQKEGVYIIKIVSDKNEVFVEKVIKK